MLSLMVCGISLKGKAQTGIAATTTDQAMYSTTTACTSSCSALYFPYADVCNLSGYSYLIPYANTGSHVVADAHTWVTDYARQTGTSVDKVINHFGAGGNAISTQLNAANASNEPYLWDPDVIQMQSGSQNLYSVYYTGTGGLAPNIPGNGSLLQPRLRLEIFTPSNPPITTSNTEIALNSFNFCSYVKNPNIDASLDNSAVAVWEEQSNTEANNHVYAKVIDDPGVISSNFFDLDPLDFEYKFFYNPDVACAVNNAQADNAPVYITFIGEGGPNSGPDLLVYYATVGEIRSGATPDPNNLHVVQANLAIHPDLYLGNHLQDYFYRPRIATAPDHETLNSDSLFRTYNIVMMRYNGTTTGTDIVSYTHYAVLPILPPYNPVHTMNVMTRTPVGDGDIDCLFNFEPVVEANHSGYDIAWTYDPDLNYWQAYTGTNSWHSVFCSTPTGLPYQAILRKRLDWQGLNAFYAEYSEVPYNPVDDEYHGISVSCDRGEVASGLGIGNSQYFFFDGYLNHQDTYFKSSDHTNSSLKRSTDRAEELPPSGTLFTMQGGNFEYSSELAPNSLRLYDVQGKLLQNESLDPKLGKYTIRTNHLQAGVYLAVFANEMEQEVIRLVVQ